MTQIAEYADVKNETWSKKEILKSAESNQLASRMVHLEHRSKGWTCAGSMARFDNGGWTVYCIIDNSRYGQQYKTEKEATTEFERRTS